MDEAIFKAYDIRGIYPDQLDETAAWKIGYATGQYLRSLLHGYERGMENSHAVCVGRDMRTHGESISKSLISGLRSSGADVIDIGMIDTPQMYFAINHLKTCGGIQVTASHNPANYNGFKISGLQAKPVSGDTGLKEIRHIASSLLHTKGNETGSFKQVDLTEQYKKHVLQFLDKNIKPLKIAIDASNGMAARMVPALFGDLPIDIIALNMTYDGTFKHEPNPLDEDNLKELKETVVAEEADAGVCFDGDADRLMVIDEKGRSVSCDLFTALMAPYFLEKHPGTTVIYDLRSSWVVREEIIAAGGTPRRERVGHSFMKKTLRDCHAAFGGELSGHFYYAANFHADSGMITFVHMLNLLSRSGKPVSEMIEPLRRYHGSGEINFKVSDKAKALKELKVRYSDGQYDDLDGVTIQYKDWWFNSRPSNTEPYLRLNVEAKTSELLSEKVAEISGLLNNIS
ncbi:Phosphomannomutase/phosphoglucomutase [Limihaloglobus sulfuriphilus]|uniref:Phosphomannomutase/phosphoglucomutase n=1 Tax=Limihaloglobus sulfuriphilus TaxID=1851148 RepID=A0A1Q2MGG4_9BACT|nr:phosphomannomutase/phosphoglucomutase [Limihaloglobus sulfuriphilus]AQQ71362.1 Phosphomannomutase/phosphoglucomutase [Limihaloglobus sulfuriphilus]